MIVTNENPSSEQKLVDEYFKTESTFWTKIYRTKDVLGVVYQQRHAIAIRYVDELMLPKNTGILEIGCGAGFMTVALAQKGFSVNAIDSVPAMISLTGRRARQTGVDKRIQVAVGDVNKLAFQDQSFNLVLALGVTPWLRNLTKALVEIARVLIPGGYVVLTSDNLYRLNHFTDPLLTPAFESTRKKVKNKLERAGLYSPKKIARPRMYTISRFNRHLLDAKLLNIKNTTIGFGPFTIFNHRLFSDRTGVKIHLKLQKSADGGFPILRSTGSQYIVLARKRS